MITRLGHAAAIGDHVELSPGATPAEAASSTTRPDRRLWAWFGRSARVVPAILFLALLLRVALILAFPITPESDSAWYLVRGREIAAGLGFQEAGSPTAFWPVGYPALVGLATAIFGLSTLGPILFNLLAQAGTVLLILWFARELGTGERAARLAALLYTVYPSHIAYTGDTAAEPTSTALVMVGAALLVRARGRIGLSFAGGLVLGLATLMRSQVLLFPPVLLGLILLTVQGCGWRRMVRAGVITAAGMMLVVLPWTARNMSALGAPVLVSSNGGVALHAGANRLADGGYFQVEKSPLWAEVGIPFSQRVERQVEIDRKLRAIATEWIAENPVRWGLLGFRKVALLWAKDTDGFWALDANYPDRALTWKLLQAANQLFYMAVLAAALAGFLLAARAAWAGRGGGPLLVAAAMPLFCTVIAYGFSGQTRYHYPAMPFLMIAAAAVLAGMLDRSRGVAHRN